MQNKMKNGKLTDTTGYTLRSRKTGAILFAAPDFKTVFWKQDECKVQCYMVTPDGEYID